MANIEAFKASFRQGVRPTKFKMEIFGLPQKLEFLCKASQLPGKTIGIIEVPYMGMVTKIAGDVTYEDLTVSVILDTDFAVRNELEAWSTSMRGQDNPNGDEPSIYKQNGSLIVLDDADDKSELAQYDFIGLWPNNISAVDFSMDSRDAIAEYTVTFSYDYWLRV